MSTQKILLSQINQNGLTENNDVDVLIDDPEVAEAMQDFKKSKILASEAERLDKAAREVFNRKLKGKNVITGHTSKQRIKITSYIQNRFNSSELKKDDPEVYNLYMRPYESTRIKVDDIDPEVLLID